MPPLRGKYNITVSSDSVISLGLKRGHQWADVADADLGTTIFLTSMKYLGVEKLSQPAQIATIIPTPTVKRGDDKVIYMTGSPRLLINGTGFRAKSMTLVFDPPIQSGVDYIMQPRSEGAVQLTLKSGKSWRPDGEPGPLKLKRINTGAGDLRIDAKYGGVTVAEVQANLGAHGVTVETTAEEKLYQSQGELTVLGTGFNTSRLAGAPGLPNPNTLRWANGLKGRGVNYTVVEASEDGTPGPASGLRASGLWTEPGRLYGRPYGRRFRQLHCESGPGIRARGAPVRSGQVPVRAPGSRPCQSSPRSQSRTRNISTC